MDVWPFSQILLHCLSEISDWPEIWFRDMIFHIQQMRAPIIDVFLSRDMISIGQPSPHILKFVFHYSLESSDWQESPTNKISA